jgi:hypothetical protein
MIKRLVETSSLQLFLLKRKYPSRDKVKGLGECALHIKFLSHFIQLPLRSSNIQTVVFILFFFVDHSWLSNRSTPFYDYGRIDHCRKYLGFLYKKQLQLSELTSRNKQASACVYLNLSRYATQAPMGRVYSSYSFFFLALEGDEWSASRPGRSLPTVPIG